MEFPERALLGALQESDMKMTIFESLAKRPTLPSSIVNLILSWLQDVESPILKDQDVRTAALGGLEVAVKLIRRVPHDCGGTPQRRALDHQMGRLGGLESAVQLIRRALHGCSGTPQRQGRGRGRQNGCLGGLEGAVQLS